MWIQCSQGNVELRLDSLLGSLAWWEGAGWAHSNDSASLDGTQMGNTQEKNGALKTTHGANFQEQAQCQDSQISLSL